MVVNLFYFLQSLKKQAYVEINAICIIILLMIIFSLSTKLKYCFASGTNLILKSYDNYRILNGIKSYVTFFILCNNKKSQSKI